MEGMADPSYFAKGTHEYNRYIRGGIGSPVRGPPTRSSVRLLPITNVDHTCDHHHQSAL